MRTSASSLLVPLSLALALTSCATGPLRLYSGPERQKEEVAIIDAGQNYEVTPTPFLWSVDGTRFAGVWGSDRPVEVLPGQHSVQAGLGWPLPNSWWAARFVSDTIDEAMNFDAEAGHTYLVKASTPDYETALTDGITSWIVDMETGKIVARSDAQPGSRN